MFMYHTFWQCIHSCTLNTITAVVIARSSPVYLEPSPLITSYSGTFAARANETAPRRPLYHSTIYPIFSVQRGEHGDNSPDSWMGLVVLVGGTYWRAMSSGTPAPNSTTQTGFRCMLPTDGQSNKPRWLLRPEPES